MTAAVPVNRWPDAEHALTYGHAVMLEVLSPAPRRVLDLGTGDGLLLVFLRSEWPDVEGIGVDFSPAMLDAARERFRGDGAVSIVDHDLDRPLPDLGRFDAVVSSFAIHHLVDERKRALYAEVFDVLAPGGVFCNLEHVDPPTVELHHAFLAALGTDPADEDPSNELAPVEAQLAWLRDAGFVDVDCLWKWRELALLVGAKPA